MGSAAPRKTALAHGRDAGASCLVNKLKSNHKLSSKNWSSFRRVIKWLVAAFPCLLNRQVPGGQLSDCSGIEINGSRLDEA